MNPPNTPFCHPFVSVVKVSTKCVIRFIHGVERQSYLILVNMSSVWLLSMGDCIQDVKIIAFRFILLWISWFLILGSTKTHKDRTLSHFTGNRLCNRYFEFHSKWVTKVTRKIEFDPCLESSWWTHILSQFFYRRDCIKGISLHHENVESNWPKRDCMKGSKL